MTASIVTYVQFENVHMTIVHEINPRIVVMASFKSSLRMYTLINMPRYVVVAHIINVLM